MQEAGPSTSTRSRKRSSTAASNDAGTKPSSPKKSPKRRHTSANTDNRQEYTEDQVRAVTRIIECVDYYEILELPRQASNTDIHGAYKRLSRLIHPDKNHAPEATEAFKKLKHVKDFLLDSQKREDYDRVHNTFEHARNERNNRAETQMSDTSEAFLRTAAYFMDPSTNRPPTDDELHKVIGVVVEGVFNGISRLAASFFARRPQQRRR